MKLLFIEGRSAEDVLESTRLFRAAKKAGHEVHVITHPEYIHLLKGNKYIDHVYKSDASRHELTAQLNLHEIDNVADLQLDEWSGTITGALQAPTIEKKKTFFEKLFSSFRKATPITDQIMNVLHLQHDGQGINFSPDKAFAVQSSEIPTSHHAGYIALALNKDLTKHGESIKSLLENIQFPVILIGDKSIRASAEAMIPANDGRIYNATGKFNEAETIHLLNDARMVIVPGNHWARIAAALGKNAVIISDSLSALHPSSWYDQMVLNRSSKKPFVVNTGLIKNGDVQKLQKDVETVLAL